MSVPAHARGAAQKKRRVREHAAVWPLRTAIYLLDVNVLIALIDPLHPHHMRAHDWFQSHAQNAWATCPITENGVIRIVGHPRYPNTPGRPSIVAAMVGKLRSLPGHVFWPDAVSLLDVAHVDASRLLVPAQLTDTYLLALAASKKGFLATFDRQLIADAVVGGKAALHVIG